MSQPKKTLSGYPFKKKRLTKHKKREILNKVQKNYFHSCNSSSKDEPMSATEEKYSDTFIPKDVLQNENEETYSLSFPVCETANVECRSAAAAAAVNLHDDKPALSDLGNDPAKWIINDATRDYIAMHGVPKNLNSHYVYSDDKILFLKDLFTDRCESGEEKARPWLVFSKSVDSVFCVPCLLFGEKSNAFSVGFSDWKNGPECALQHQNSECHKVCVSILKQRAAAKLQERIIPQLNMERQNRRDILERVSSTVKKVCRLGLQLQNYNYDEDDEEMYERWEDGNYVTLLELIGRYDPCMSEYLNLYGRDGFWLSKTVCDEFIKLLKEKLTTQIMSEVRKSKYYGIIIDSVSDISHCDDLAFIIRYVKEDGKAVERFMDFIPFPMTKSQPLSETVMNTLETYGLDIKDCCGLSYDSVGCLSNAYSALQARICEVNELAQYIPCAAHSLNTIGLNASDRIITTEFPSFFHILEKLYKFFTASDYRWAKLLSFIKPGTSEFELLSQTRWSSKYDVSQTLLKSWNDIVDGLEQISKDYHQDTFEVECILEGLESLQTAVMTCVWAPILQRFKADDLQLQSVNTDLGTVVELYRSLSELVRGIRDSFDHYEHSGKLLCGVDKYEEMTLTFLKKSNFFNTPRDYCLKVFKVVMNSLLEELTKRRDVYNTLNNHFGFLEKLHTLTESEISVATSRLVAFFKRDLELDGFTFECNSLSGYLKGLTKETTFSLPQLCNMLYERGIQDDFPNVHVALRMFLSTSATVCFGDQTYSTLRRVEDYLQKPMMDKQVKLFASLTIEGELVDAIDNKDLIDMFEEQSLGRICSEAAPTWNTVDI